MADFTLKVGDTVPPLTATLIDANGAVDLTNATKVMLHLSSGSTIKVNRQCSVINAATGQVAYSWQFADTSTAGILQGEFEVYWLDGSCQRFPNTGNFTVQIIANIA